MYSACLFCAASLGRNDVIATFPIGRRLAFDADRGRLWAVCAHCRQWCLTPVEERWEAIEECERHFRATTRRVSTDQIGLARLREGLELIRIGKPLRPEMAAWRYGPQLGRRRRQALFVAASFALQNRVVARIPTGTWHAFIVRGGAASRTVIEPTETGGWRLHLHHDGGVHTFEGAHGLRAVRHLLAGVNRFGATNGQVQHAVDMLSVVQDPADYFPYVAAKQRTLGEVPVTQLPHAVRLALEMAAHDEVERRAMEGELAQLADAWREAEEVAGIADDMFLPASIGAFLRRHR